MIVVLEFKMKARDFWYYQMKIIVQKWWRGSFITLSSDITKSFDKKVEDFIKN